jgi:hypothetical protein
MLCNSLEGDLTARIGNGDKIGSEKTIGKCLMKWPIFWPQILTKEPKEVENLRPRTYC